jgi:hypothetical protein
MDVAGTLVELIGNTPMLRLDRTARDLECTLVAKLELLNPAGSSKDRIALAVIQGAGPLGRDRRGRNCIFVRGRGSVLSRRSIGGRRSGGPGLSLTCSPWARARGEAPIRRFSEWCRRPGSTGGRAR